MRPEQPTSAAGFEAARHTIFVIGRIRKGEQKLIFLRPPLQPPFPGPWEIRAAVRAD